MTESAVKIEDIAVSRTPRTVSPADEQILAGQLGRPARGVVEIAARCVCGTPLVVRTAPRLPSGEPFPTTYYLTHPVAATAIAHFEADGFMARFNARLADDEAFRQAYQRAHEDYLRRRAELGDVPEIAGISAGGMPWRVKCLHALAAHALAVGPHINLVGDETLVLISPRWRPDRCQCPPPMT